MKNEIEQIAQQNDMSIEFVTWFFNEKKVGCGNVWFMMMAAMWEGWKGRSIEMDKLAAENVALKDINAWCKTDAFKNMYREFKTAESLGCSDVDCMHDAMLVAIMHAPETPATDRIMAEAEARGVEKFAAKLRIPGDDQFFDALAKGVALSADDFAKQMREGADK
ncbi:Phage protein [Klebsiella pneumoniae]